MSKMLYRLCLFSSHSFWYYNDLQNGAIPLITAYKPAHCQTHEPMISFTLATPLSRHAKKIWRWSVSWLSRTAVHWRNNDDYDNT